MCTVTAKVHIFVLFTILFTIFFIIKRFTQPQSPPQLTNKTHKPKHQFFYRKTFYVVAYLLLNYLDNVSTKFFNSLISSSGIKSPTVLLRKTLLAISIFFNMGNI